MCRRLKLFFIQSFWVYKYMRYTFAINALNLKPCPKIDTEKSIPNLKTRKSHTFAPYNEFARSRHYYLQYFCAFSTRVAKQIFRVLYTPKQNANKIISNGRTGGLITRIRASAGGRHRQPVLVSSLDIYGYNKIIST